MSDAGDGEGVGPGGRPDPEAVGNVGEEAAKLLGALSDWARDQADDHVGNTSRAAGTFSDAIGSVGEHVATGGEDCRYCPVCQAIHAVRQTSPEVRAHLAVAASSLIQAAAGLLATPTEAQDQQGAVEKIDLDSGNDWDETP